MDNIFVDFIGNNHALRTSSDHIFSDVLHFSDLPHTGGIDSRRRHADGADAGQLPRRRQGSRGRWRKPLRISVHGKRPEGRSVRQRSVGAGVPVGFASWCA